MKLLVYNGVALHANPEKSRIGTPGVGHVSWVLPNNLNGGSLGRKEKEGVFWLIEVPKINTKAAIERWTNLLTQHQHYSDDSLTEDPEEETVGAGTNNPQKRVRIYREREVRIALNAMNPDKAAALTEFRSKPRARNTKMRMDLTPNEFRECLVQARFYEAYAWSQGDPVHYVVDDPAFPTLSDKTAEEVETVREGRRFKSKTPWSDKAETDALGDERNRELKDYDEKIQRMKDRTGKGRG